MYEELGQEEILQALDTLIRKSEGMLETAEEQLQKARTTLLTLTVKEHITGAGSLSQEEEASRDLALSSFRDLRDKVGFERKRLEKLRAAREEWETGVPSSLQNRFEDLLTTG